MITFIIKRILYFIPLFFLISIVSFIVMELPPGDFLASKIQELQQQGDLSAINRIEEYKVRYGLDKLLFVRYWIWISKFVRGDFGLSFDYELPVRQLIWERLGLTMVLSILSIIFSWVVALPIGIYSATHQYSPADHTFTFISFIGLSIPSFLLALVIMFIAVFVFNQSVGGLFSPEFADASWSLGKVVDLLKHAWIPVIVIGMAGTASLMRIMRGNLLDILGQMYIQTARAKGLRERVVIYKHAVRNALHPLIMSLGMTLPVVISGETLVAIVLNLPTTGPLFLRALQRQDMMLAASFLMWLTILLIFGNLLADIVLAWVDPRIRYD